MVDFRRVKKLLNEASDLDFKPEKVDNRTVKKHKKEDGEVKEPADKVGGSGKDKGKGKGKAKAKNQDEDEAEVEGEDGFEIQQSTDGAGSSSTTKLVKTSGSIEEQKKALIETVFAESEIAPEGGADQGDMLKLREVYGENACLVADPGTIRMALTGTRVQASPV